MTGVLVDPAFAQTYQPPPQGAPQPAPQGVLAPPSYPNAGVIESLMQTPESAYRQYRRAHPITTIASMIAAGFQGGPAAQETERQTLAARQMQPLQLAQQRAAFQGAMMAYENASTPEAKAAVLTDLPDYMKQQIQNMQLIKLSKNDVLANQANPGGMAPPVPDVDPYTFSQYGIGNRSSGAFTGISQPVSSPPQNNLLPFTPQANGAPAGNAGAGMGQGGPQGATTIAAGNPASRLTGPDFFNQFYAKHEGAVNPADANGAASYWGLNVAANPDIKGPLTKGEAEPIFTQRYFDASGANNLPAPLAALHADTYAMNPGWARLALAQSGGDPNRYMAIRQRLQQADLVRNPKVRPYATAWANRNRDLVNYANQLGGNVQGSQEAAPANAAEAPAPSGQGFGAPIVQGRGAEVIPPDQAQAMGYGPGVLVRNPDQTLKFTPAPKDDTDRLAGITKGLDAAHSLLVSGQRFSSHNVQATTGLQYFDPLEGKGEGEHNPLAVYAMKTNPHVSQMEAEHANQTFLIKNPDIGRILQSEIPFWEAQAQGIDLTPEVNAQRLTEYAKAYQYLNAKQSFMKTWLYKDGSLGPGFEPAWEKYWASISPDTHGGSAQGNASPAQATGRRLRFNPDTGRIE